MLINFLYPYNFNLYNKLINNVCIVVAGMMKVKVVMGEDRPPRCAQTIDPNGCDKTSCKLMCIIYHPYDGEGLCVQNPANIEFYQCICLYKIGC